jgi:UTP--glucose-1-phosphate uridylyltransferase
MAVYCNGLSLANTMKTSIKKAVFPVAGLGTRLLPATKVIPKEMLTIVDRPVIQLVVEEAREAGIEHFIFVTGRNKGTIEDHFDKQYELEDALRLRGKSLELDLLAMGLPAAGQASFTRQQEPLGLGHAIWCARALVGEEPFAILLPDMLIHAKPGCLSQMVEIYTQTGGNIIAVEQVPAEHVHRYGVVAPGKKLGGAFEITDIVEKPRVESAPSNLIISGRYILQPSIFAKLAKQRRGAGGEIQLTDAMIELVREEPFYGLQFVGRTFDCGDRLGFLLANMAYGLEHELVGKEFRAALIDYLKSTGIASSERS